MSLSYRTDTRANALPAAMTSTAPTNGSSPDEAEAGSSTPPSAPPKVSYDNVNNFVATPPGYQGEIRPGHLVFNANYESGEFDLV